MGLFLGLIWGGSAGDGFILGRRERVIGDIFRMKESLTCVTTCIDESGSCCLECLMVWAGGKREDD